MDDLERELKKAFEQATEAYRSINDYAIEIGVVEENTKRKPEKEDAEKKTKGKTKQTVASIGITNAQLMFIHENGSPLHHIPARPALQYTIDEAIKTLLPATLKRIEDGCFNHNWTKADVKIELEKMCVRMQSIARRIIFRSNKLEKNSPATIKAKGSDQPLVDTGKLGRSITCQLVLRSEPKIKTNDSG